MLNNLILDGKVYNVPAMLMVVKYAARITREAWYYIDPEDNETTCHFCGVTTDDIEDECLHDHTCLWRLLKESVANVDNEGYE